MAKNVGSGCSVAHKSICFDQGVKCFCEIFLAGVDNPLFPVKLKQDLTVEILLIL